MSESHSPMLNEEQNGSDLAAALARLNKALDSLDNAVDVSQETRKKLGSFDEELQRMADDRSKLAQQLDKTEDRAQRLSETNKEVSRRLVAAMETVRSVLDQPV